MQLMRAGSDTTTEDISEDEKDGQGRGHEIKGAPPDSRKSAWSFLLQRAQLDLMDTKDASYETHKDVKKYGRDNTENENDRDCSQVSAILERVDRQCMVQATLKAFEVVQMRRPASKKEIEWLLNYWDKLSGLCGKDLTLGVTAAIVGALHEEDGELKPEGKSKALLDPHIKSQTRNCANSKHALSTDPSTIQSNHEQHLGLLAQELEAMLKDAQRLRTSPIFKALDDKRTGLMVTEVDFSNNNVVTAWNRPYLNIFPDPYFLLCEGIARGCLPLYLLTTFVAHDDREAWLRMNLDAWSAANASAAEEGLEGKEEGMRERCLHSEFLKVCNPEGNISLWWVRFSKVGRNYAHCEGGQRVYIVLRTEKVPFSRYITDQPEKKKKRSKTNLFRRRPSQDLPVTVSVAAESPSLLGDAQKEMPGSGKYDITKSTTSFPAIACLAFAPCTHLPVTSRVEKDSLGSHTEKNVDSYTYPASTALKLSLGTQSNLHVPCALPPCSLSPSACNVPARLFDVKSKFLENVLFAAHKGVPGMEQIGTNELQYSRESAMSLDWLQRERAYSSKVTLLSDGNIVRDDVEKIITTQKPQQQHTNNLLPHRRPNSLLTLPSGVFSGVVSEWGLEQRTPPARLQWQQMYHVQKEYHLLLNQGNPRQQLFDNLPTRAMPVEQQQQQLLYSPPLIERRQYDEQSEIKIRNKKRQRTDGELTQDMRSQLNLRVDSRTTRHHQIKNPARESEQQQKKQPKPQQQMLRVSALELQQQSLPKSDLGTLHARESCMPSPFKKRVGSGLYLLRAAAELQKGEPEKMHQE